MTNSARVVPAILVVALLGGCGAHKSATGAKAAVATANPTGAVALPKVGVEARAEFDEGLRVMRTGRKHYKEARTHFVKATQIDAQLFEGWHDLGVIDAALGNFDAAADSFRKAMDVQPGSRKTVLAYGETLRRGRQARKAAKLYQKWLETNEGDGEIRARLGQVLREGGDLDQSLEQARLLLGQAAGDPTKTVVAYNALGLTYYKMGKLDLAETALRKALEIDQKSAFIWNNLGLVALERGHDQEAFLDFQKGSELDPKYVQARLNKAVVYLDCGDYKHARTELERAVEIDPNDPEAQVALGVAARGDGKLDHARRAYERALDIEPDYPPALFNLGLLYMDFDKDKVKARDYFTQFNQHADSGDPKRADAQARLQELR